MNTDNHFTNWCRMPPEPPKNRHKKLLAGSLIFAVLSVSLFASLPLFSVSMMAGQTGALVAPSVSLSVANVAEGPKYIQNVTYQCTNQTAQPSQNTDLDTLQFGSTSIYSAGDVGYTTVNLVNNGDENLTVSLIEIYRGDSLFASIEGPFTVNPHSEGLIDFQVNNLREMVKDEVQWITGKQEVMVDWVQQWHPILYRAVLKTPEGTAIVDDSFCFPTTPGNGSV